MSDKEKFFTSEYPILLDKISPDKNPEWGVLSLQGMIEHMTDSIGVGWQRIQQVQQYSDEITNKSRAFMLSEKPFKPGTKNSLMSEIAAPLRCNNLNEAKKELLIEIKNFIEFWEKNPNHKVTNPFFGNLNYSEWLHLLHKHAIHHLKQFGIE